MPIEVEVLIPLVLSLFFSLLYETNPRQMRWSGVIAFGIWLISGMLFLLTSTYPIVAMVFLMPAMIYLIRILLDAYKPLDTGRRLEGDTD